VLAANYREAVLPNQVRTAQQTLAGLVTAYLAALSDQWAAVVSVASLQQADDLYLGGAEGPLDELHAPPCEQPPGAGRVIIGPPRRGSR